MVDPYTPNPYAPTRKHGWFWTMFRITFFIGIFIGIGGCLYGGWCAQRWINYKWNYQGHVVKEIEPFKTELEELRKRVEALENAKGQERKEAPKAPEKDRP